MEPTLTPPDPTDDPLEALLHAAPPHIPDDGFTLRVCAALPLREIPRPHYLRRVVLAGAALLGCALALWISSPDWPAISHTVFAAMLGQKFEIWWVLPLVLVLTIWGTFAVSRNEWAGDALARR